eukprot:1521835-Pyramimonas_sp.AAC.1
MSPQVVQKLAAAAQRDVLNAQRQTFENIMQKVELYVPADFRDSIRVDADACGLPQLEKLAKIGTSGSHANNCNRDLMQLIRNYRFPKPSVETIPMAISPGKVQLIPKSQCFLWPHEMIAALYDKYPDMFSQSVCCGGRHRVQAFWRNMVASQHPLLRNHPMKSVQGWSSLFIPLSLHGDAVPVSGCGKPWAKSYTIFSWSSLLGRGGTLACNFMIYAVFASMFPNASKLAFWKKMIKSFLALFDGVWPSGSPKAGQPLAGGYRACLWMLKGDLKYWADDLGLPSH